MGTVHLESTSDGTETDTTILYTDGTTAGLEISSSNTVESDEGGRTETVTSDSSTSHESTSESVTSKSVTSDSVTSEFVTSESVTSESVTGTSEDVTDHTDISSSTESPDISLNCASMVYYDEPYGMYCYSSMT